MYVFASFDADTILYLREGLIMSTIAAISTPKGVGGIGVIRISGDEAIEIVNKIFVPFNSKSSVLNMKGYTAKYGKISRNGNYIDEVIILVFRAPHSYTGENVVEISCHGGLYITREVLRTVLDEGASLAEPGEFTKRAFLNGKIDLSQAESVMELISSNSRRSNIIAFNQKEGALSRKTEFMKNTLLDISAGLAVWADFPEEDIPEVNYEKLISDLKKVADEMSSIIKNYNPVLKDGVKTVIIGRPNVGKSTLMNLISGFEKSIVTDIAGTTRDIVEETVMVGDIPLLLVDTAGIRETEDKVEKIGVSRAKKSLSTADLVLMVLDASQDSLSKEDKEILDLCDPKKTIIVLNKIDLGIMINKENLSTFSESIVEISALKAEGEENFKKAIENAVGKSKAEPTEVLITCERQFLALKKSLENVNDAISDAQTGVTLDAITVLIQNAIDSLMELTGENANVETVNKIFSKFCVGK